MGRQALLDFLDGKNGSPALRPGDRSPRWAVKPKSASCAMVAATARQLGCHRLGFGSDRTQRGRPAGCYLYTDPLVVFGFRVNASGAKAVPLTVPNDRP